MYKIDVVFPLKILQLIMLILLFLIFLISSCELVNTPPPPGNIVFVFDDDDPSLETKNILYGQEGIIDFGKQLVQPGPFVYEQYVKPLKIKNSGEGDLLITNIIIDGDGFKFADDISPDLPFIIPPGKTISDVFIEFVPIDGLEYSGTVYIETEKSTHYLDLAGIGLWQLTLTVSAGENGKITSPVEVLSDSVIDTSKTVTSVTNVFDLACEIDFLNEFVGWTIIGTPDVDPIFGNQIAKETTVELKSHTEISMDILVPFVKVPGDAATIGAAIIACIADSDKKAVVVSKGSYNESFNLVSDVPIYGGYRIVDTNWTDRLYKTYTDRNNESYQTIINGSITSGSGIGSNVILEGFVINGNVTFSSGTKAVLQYNTITGSGSNPAVTIDNASNTIQNNVITGGSGGSESIAIFSTNDAAPSIFNNTITAGTTSDDYSKTYGIKVTEGSKPVIYKNNIDAGTAGGTGSKSYGVFNDFECEPLITGNTIYGGAAAGTDGQSYGIYMINNGKVTAGYNSINAGSGKTSYGLYVYQGGNLYLDYNNILTSSSTGHGVYIGFSGRLRRLQNNGLYDCPTSLVYDYYGGAIKDIDAVNDLSGSGGNTTEAITFTIPEDPNYE